MSRSTVYNNIVTDKNWALVNEKNKKLMEEFVDYLNSADRSDKTVSQYNSQLRIFFVWNLEHNDNKFFIDLKKKDLIRYMGYLRNVLGSSPNRICSQKSVLCSLSNYIEQFDDEEYPEFRNIAKIIESPVKTNIRKKTILEQEEVDNCLNKLVKDKKYQLACFFALSIACGARKSELCRFKVDYFKDEHIVYGCLYETPEEIKTKGRGKLGKQLKKYTFVKQFKPYFDLWMKERKEKGIDNEYLFVTYRDGTWETATDITATSWGKTIERYLGRDYYAHCCRHMWVSTLLQQGLPDNVIMELQGWSSLEMVKLYSDLDVKDSFSKYFDENGIIEQEAIKLTDIK
ncbi:MAG: site-specific integrase [Oscillospiraceae bacterium]